MKNSLMVFQKKKNHFGPENGVTYSAANKGFWNGW